MKSLVGAEKLHGETFLLGFNSNNGDTYLIFVIFLHKQDFASNFLHKKIRKLATKCTFIFTNKQELSTKM